MAGIFGKIEAPSTSAYFTAGTKGEGLFLLLSNIFKFAGVVAGIFFVVQLILAGFSYISANGDPKNVQAAWAKIYQSLIGLVIIASAFVIAAVVGRILGIDILNFNIYGPGDK